METARLIPSTIYNAASSYLTISNASNAYTNADSTTYATVQNTNASTSNRYIYLRGFDFSSIPSNATVNSFTVKLKAYQSGGSTNTSYRPYLCNNTTTITGNCGVITTSTQTLSFTGVTADWDTIKGYGSNFGIRINCRRNSRNTVAYFYIYGAEIEVNYTVPVYHNVTVTGDSSKVSPTGTESVLEGTEYSVSMAYDSHPTVTDNGVNVSSQLIETTGGTSTLIPEDYTSTNFTVSNITNAYHDATNTTYATFDAAGGSTTGTVYLDLGGDVIPSEATIVSVACQATIQFSRNGSSSGVTASCQMYTGSTAKGTATTITSSATDVAKTTYNLSIGTWTAAEIANARFYMTMTNNASSTHRYLYLYGVSFTVTYTISGKIYVYTLSNITADHTIVVTAPTAQDKLYVKVEGTEELLGSNTSSDYDSNPIDVQLSDSDISIGDELRVVLTDIRGWYSGQVIITGSYEIEFTRTATYPNQYAYPNGASSGTGVRVFQYNNTWPTIQFYPYSSERTTDGFDGTIEVYKKTSGGWVEGSAVYKKVSGSWVLQTDLTNVFDSGTNYKMG